jgi:hypothetical protein
VLKQKAFSCLVLENLINEICCRVYIFFKSLGGDFYIFLVLVEIIKNKNLAHT